MNFVSLTLNNGQPLDIPAASIVFLESLDDEGKAANPGCRSGLFFDLGNGEPQTSVVQEPFPKLAKAVLAGAMVPMIELQRADKGKVLLAAHNVVALRGLGDDHPNDGRCQITHRVGPRLLLLDVLQTRDDIKTMLPAPAAPAAPEGEKSDGDAT